MNVNTEAGNKMHEARYKIKSFIKKICFSNITQNTLRRTSDNKPLISKKRRATDVGMTLIEVIVAMSILAMIMVLLWGTISQGLNSKDRVEKRDQVLNQGRVVYHKLLDDLSMAFLSKPAKEESGENKVLLTYFIVEDNGDQDLIKFTSFSHLRYFANAKESDQCQLEYKLVRPEDTGDEEVVGMNLVRIEAPWLDDNSNVEGNPYVLAKNVKSFSLDFYDDRKEEWVEQWDTEKIDWKGRLPKAVRMKIEFFNPINENESPVVFTSAIILPMSGSTVEF